VGLQQALALAGPARGSKHCEKIFGLKLEIMFEFELLSNSNCTQ
jgi:hypothetical protein